jgi:L-ascorbate metabolism protein UlaG (beta-lactamase superfamily)
MGREGKYRLADSALIEPLINQWSAWAHVVSPAPASLHLVNYQLKTMQSFLESPEAHAAASRNPSLVGGPFMALPPERAPDVRELLNFTLARQRKNVELARAILEFSDALASEAAGQCLEPFYERVPGPLRGYVELVYDYYHRPSVRLIEGLLYESEYYDAGLQSLRLGRLGRYDERAFFMSTPRLPEPGQIDWPVPFESELVDAVFRLDTTPQTLGYIAELFGMGEGGLARLRPLLTDEPAPAREPWDEPRVRFRYFGHACVLAEWNGVSILTDPFVGVRPALGGMEQWSYGDLPESIDYALVTHNHQDHFAVETLLRLRHRLKCVVVPKSSGHLYGDVSLKLMLRKLGFKNVVELDALESITLPGGEIVAVPFLGEHGDLAHSKSAYVVRAGREQMLFAADSDCLDVRMYEHLRRSLGSIETVFLGMECVGAPLTWSCGPLFPKVPPRQIDQTRRHHGCDSSRALKILRAAGARRVYNYAMGMEPWLEHLLGLGLQPDSKQMRESDELLARAGGADGVMAERLFGKDEFCLNGGGGKSSRVFVPPVFGRAEAAAPARRPDYAGAADARDEFAF